VRGATNPNETLGAQQLKGQFATLRLDSNQKDVARFSKDLVVIMAEIIAKHFSLDTIKQVSGVKLMTQEEKAAVQAQIQQAQQQYQMMAQQAQAQQQEPPPQPEVPEDIEELLDLPTWEEIEAVIRDDTARNFRIDIETDSTIKTDQENEKQARVEFLGAVSQFMAQAVNIPPALQPLAMEMLMFGVRGFKVSRELETSFEATMREMRKEEDAPPQPDPQMQIEQMKSEQEAQKMQFEGQKMQQEKYLADQNFQLEQQKLAVEQQKSSNEVAKARIDAKASVSPDVAMTDNDLNEGQSPMLMMMQAMTEGFTR
jgi:hypothetical protein